MKIPDVAIALLTTTFAIGHMIRAGEIEIVDGVPPGFEVVRVTNEEIRSTIPVINDLSEVVWSTRIGDTIANLHRFSNGLVERLTDDTTFDMWPVINNASEMAWMRCPIPVEPPCDLLTTYSEGPIHGEFPIMVNSAEINDAGDAAWDFPIGDEDLHNEIVLYRRDIGTSEIVTNVGLNNQLPRINNSRQITWTRFDFSVAPWESTIMFWSDGVVTAVSSGSSQAQASDLNDEGHVIWGDGAEIFLWDGEQTTNVTACIEAVAGQPRINNSGDIYFGLWNTELGKWDAILLRGETLYRLPDFGLSNSQGSLNDRGELAWRGGQEGLPFWNIVLMRRVAPSGDMNHDCHLDLVDLRIMQICNTGSENAPPGGLLAQCARADFDGDGDVDVHDFELFLEVQTGPDVLVPNCEP